MARFTIRAARVLAAVAVAMTLWAQVAPASAAAATPRRWHPPKAQRVKVLRRELAKVARHRWDLPKVPEGGRTATQWPAGGAADVTFARAGRMVRAGSLPVLAGAGGTAATVPGAQVRVFGHARAVGLGISGVVFQVSAPPGPGGLV